MWHERIEDFGQEIEPDTSFRFECHPGLSCFGMCCGTEVALMPYDVARIRRHLSVDSGGFLRTYCETYIDRRTGFPYVVLRRREDGRCVFLGRGGCDVYESRPSCCRSYPLSRVIDEDGKTGERLIRYYLQREATYCDGLGKGPDWTIRAYCEANGLGLYDKANDLSLDIPFAFNGLPDGVRQNRDVQGMVFEAVFNFDTFFEKYGRFPRTAKPEDDHDTIVLVRSIVLNLLEKTAQLKTKECI